MRFRKNRVVQHVPDAVAVYRTDGSVATKNLLFEVHEFLQARDSSVDAACFREHIGVDLEDPRNSKWLKLLEANPLVTVLRRPEGVLVARSPAFGVSNTGSLRRLVLRLLPEGRAGQEDKSGRFGARVGVRASDLADTYADVHSDLNEMAVDGELLALACDGTKGETVYFCHPRGVCAAQSVRDMWSSVELPSAGEVRSYLLERGLRNSQSYAERRERHVVLMEASRPRPKRARAGGAR